MTDDTFLYRQIHPNFVHTNPQTGEERATSQAFRPTPDGKISTYDGDQITAADSWTHYTQILGRRSCGVMAVTKAECQRVGLSIIPDGVPFREHISIDCRGLDHRQIEANAKRLRAAANARGWQFRPL